MNIRNVVTRLPELRFEEPLNWIIEEGQQWGVIGPNGDGVVTAADALLVMRCALGTAELSPETAALCDTDEDGNVTLSDAVLILRAALGLG